MNKASVLGVAALGQTRAKLTGDADLQAFRTLALELKNNPAKRREITIQAGIVTATGQLKKAYRQK